ncbi:uracil-DNA glycosylase [Buchnera aphidicola]|uniref:uracil-DNA glycosylase n=1 Tax=Buchnera aphidicola TaxID=9 RepID=UPI0034646B89
MEKITTTRKKKKYFNEIINFINLEKKHKIIYPPNHKIFYFLKITEFYRVKVVIIGQDPYYQTNQANGLAFSVPKGIKIPPSLINIYKELSNDILGWKFPNHGCLYKWAIQGVFLLNTILTVEHGKPFSHSNVGWNFFTDYIISLINKHLTGIIFLLWGSKAQKKVNLIDSNKHYILKSSHPSPLAAHRGFFGCKHFSKVNKILLLNNQKKIDWSLI